MTGGSAGSASADPKGTTAVPVKRLPALKVPPSSRPKAVLKSAPSAVTRVPPPVERYVVPSGPAVAPNFRMADFPMIFTGLLMETEEKRAKRTSDEQQLHDAMLAAIFKAVFEDTVPESYAGIYSSGKKDRMGCEMPKVIDFRTLPETVQDDLMRAEILPTMWPRYRISGCERLLTPGATDNMYPRSVDREHRDWINALMHTSGGLSEPVDQLILAAVECAVEILNDAGSFVTGVDKFNAYQLDLFLFEDMGIGGFLAKFIGKMSDPDIGGFTGFSLPEPVLT